MRALLDTHVLLWVLLGSSRLKEFPRLEAYRPWAISPVSLLEIEFLSEVGRLEVRGPELRAAIGRDTRFELDDPGLSSLVHQALGLSWTRDPFDRLLAAHSSARKLPLVTADQNLRAHHRWLAE
ncbi:MAG: PIN domain-containing protein [Thermoanaerobaculia bacterium]